MTEPPLLARALLWIAMMLTPVSDRVWIDAMRGDLDVAHSQGRASTWAFGCLIAAVRFRGAAMVVLTPRRRRIVAFGFLMLVCSGSYAFSFSVSSSVRPHGVIGYLIVLVPIAVIVALLAWWMVHDVPTVIDDAWIRRSLLFWVVPAAILLAGDVTVMRSGGRFWTILVASLSSASLLLVSLAIIGMLTTLTTVTVLCTNFHRLPRRIPRVLPYERRFVTFFGADRAEMLARVDAGAPEMTLPRGWLINSTLTCTFVLIEVASQWLTRDMSRVAGAGDEWNLAYLCAFAAAVCVANMLYVMAHVRFARCKPDR